jgi:HD-like signal output (HDOD) protein
MEAMLDQEFVRNLTIPPRPEIVSVLFEEMSRDEPDLAKVSHNISSDVGLSAAMLKAANSPAFGLSRKLSSVDQAVGFLGMRNVSGIATGLAIRHALSGGSAENHRQFWDMAEKTAILCATLARTLRGIAVDEAYTFGLFHDCGIPLLMHRFPKYEATLARAGRGEQGFAEVEQADVGTHHGAVGYFLTRSWQLPDDFCRAVLWHHDTEVFEDRSVDEPVRNFVGIVHLAEELLNRVLCDEPGGEWARFEAHVLDHFGLGEDDLISLTDAARDAIGGD